LCEFILNRDKKNQPGKIIVVYDEDERLGHNAATTLVQRGYDNLFLLSGGQLSSIFIRTSVVQYNGTRRTCSYDGESF
jgi:hypothetical protein